MGKHLIIETTVSTKLLDEIISEGKPYVLCYIEDGKQVNFASNMDRVNGENLVIQLAGIIKRNRGVK